MINLLASIADTPTTETIEGAGNILSYGGQMMLIGMCTVFAVLTIIWFSIVALKYLLNNNQSANESKDANTSQPTAQTTAPQYTDDAEIIAVIAAAIAAAESENNGLKFRVVSFRRK